ncbi:hypothetical protein VNO77_04789 [Canavalia gladiata]|uniref:Uncharacterized protein n=1 Tax=Canavalia gladiata TaxID=3824 RepID=A0AAN9MX53_CANGL
MGENIQVVLPNLWQQTIQYNPPLPYSHLSSSLFSLSSFFFVNSISEPFSPLLPNSMNTQKPILTCVPRVL